MPEIPFGRMKQEYGFDRYASAVSGSVERTVRYRGSEIVKGYFGLVEEACGALNIPLTAVRVGDSDLRLIRLFNPNFAELFSPRVFQLDSRCDLSGKTYLEAQKEVNDLLSDPLEAVAFELGRKNPGGGWSRGHDFEAVERVSSPLQAIDELFSLPSNGGTSLDQETIRRTVENEGDLAAGGLKYTYIDTDLATIKGRVPFSERVGFAKRLLVEWTQILFYKGRSVTH